MIRVTIEEFKNDVDKYIEISSSEDVYVVDGNEIITLLTSPQTKAFLDMLIFREQLNVDPGFDPNKALEEELMFKNGLKIY